MRILAKTIIIFMISFPAYAGNEINDRIEPLPIPEPSKQAISSPSISSDKPLLPRSTVPSPHINKFDTIFIGKYVSQGNVLPPQVDCLNISEACSLAEREYAKNSQQAAKFEVIKVITSPVPMLKGVSLIFPVGAAPSNLSEGIYLVIGYSGKSKGWTNLLMIETSSQQIVPIGYK